MATRTLFRSASISVVDYQCDAGPEDRPFVEIHGGYSIAYVSKGVLCSRGASGAGFGPTGQPAFWLLPAKGGPGTHVAFSAGDRAAVDKFHAAGLKAGGKDNGGPGVRADYGPKYYAAFLLDPGGNNVEAVCLR